MKDYERIIKKYPNRRLYDTAISSYITLEEVKILSQEEPPLKIIETRTGKEITQNVLLQVIADLGEKQNLVLSQNFLRKIICYTGSDKQTKLSEFLDKSICQFVEENPKIESKNNLNNNVSFNSAAKENSQTFVQNNMRTSERTPGTFSQ